MIIIIMIGTWRAADHSAPHLGPLADSAHRRRSGLPIGGAIWAQRWMETLGRRPGLWERQSPAERQIYARGLSAVCTHWAPVGGERPSGG